MTAAQKGEGQLEKGREDVAARPAHVPALDGLRGIAILVVMLLHFRLAVQGPMDALPDRALLKVVSAGWVGVDLFFVLSGFLITGILLQSRQDPQYYRTFFARRALRIFPLYYGFLVLRFLIAPLLFDREYLPTPLVDQLWIWTYLTNVKLAIDNEFTGIWGVAHFWSLAVEEQFYLVWPFVVRHCTNRRLAIVCGLMLIGAPVVRLTEALLERHFEFVTYAAYVLPVGRMDTFAMGGLLALAATNRLLLDRLGRYVPLTLVSTGLLLVAVFIWRRGFVWADPVVKGAGYSLLVLFLGALVLGGVTGRGRAREAVEHPVLRFFGKYSYGIYVWHLPLIPLFSNYGFSPNGWWSTQWHQLTGFRFMGVVAWMGSAILLSTLVALASWHLWEKHFLKLKRHFRYSGMRGALGEEAADIHGNATAKSRRPTPLRP